MKTIISLFFYIFLMVSNVFFLLQSEDTTLTSSMNQRDLIYHKSLDFNAELMLHNFIK